MPLVEQVLLHTSITCWSANTRRALMAWGGSIPELSLACRHSGNCGHSHAKALHA